MSRPADTGPERGRAAGLVPRLRDIFGAAQVVDDPATCWTYGYDNSRRHAAPEVVVFAAGEAQIAALLALCSAEGVSVVARGRGTGTTGGTVPLRGGVVLSLERMGRILEIDPSNRMMRVEPGVTNQAVQEAAGRHGFFWPPDPTSAAYATVGGNLGFNSAGPRAVKYGTPRENTLGLRAVTGAGEVLRTGVYTTKGVVGYDFTRLLIGAEGTLAVITEATLKLTPRPEAHTGMRALYHDVHAAAAAIARIMGQPVVPSSLEYMDASALDLARRHGDLDLPPAAGGLLMIEVDGPAGCLGEAADAVAAAASGEGLIRLERADDPARLARLWAARKALSPALRSLAPKKINEDVAVPVSRLPELLTGLASLADTHAITIVSFGHAGNGNIHVNLLIDPDDPRQRAAATQCLDQLFTMVLDLGGTLSGEHGVGIEKRDFVARELDPVALRLMRQVKAQFDPRGILNPDKIFPLEESAGG